jgi:hypothetical protein
MKAPETTLPSVLRTAIILIVTLFLSANFGLYMNIPAEEFDHTNAPVLVRLGSKKDQPKRVYTYSTLITHANISSLKGFRENIIRENRCSALHLGCLPVLPRRFELNSILIGQSDTSCSRATLSSQILESQRETCRRGAT